MASYYVLIPAAQFTTGGAFDGQDERKVVFPIPVKTKNQPWLNVTWEQKWFEDWQFQPDTSEEWDFLLEACQSGQIEFYNDSNTKQTPADLVALYKTAYQQL